MNRSLSAHLDKENLEKKDRERERETWLEDYAITVIQNHGEGKRGKFLDYRVKFNFLFFFYFQKRRNNIEFHSLFENLIIGIIDRTGGLYYKREILLYGYGNRTSDYVRYCADNLCSLLPLNEI